MSNFNAMKVINKHGLKLVSTKNMPRMDWLQLRMGGLGGSDIGTIMGVNKNFSRLELFYQKCGASPDTTEINPPIFWGNQLEAVVRDAAQYLDIETQDYLKNFEAKKKVRKITGFKYIVQNEQYPWLLANVDGLIGFTARSFKAKRVAEIKTISRQSAEMWSTIPVYHWFQVQTYAGVLSPMLTEDVSNIFYLQDGRELSGWDIPFSQDAWQNIVDITYEFWERVVKGREIVKTTPDGRKRLQYLSEIEPDPEPTSAYVDFLSNLYRQKQSQKTVEGTNEHLGYALEYQELGENIKELNIQRDVAKAKIINSLRQCDAKVVTFDNGRRITYNKRLYVNI